MVGRLAAVLIGLAALLGIPAGAAPPDLIVEADVSAPRVYVQQQVGYTVRVWRRSSLLSGIILTPEIPGVMVEPAGESGPRTANRDGVDYQVIERRFALFPQRVGRVDLPPPVYSGRSAFAKGTATRLEVLPPPPGAPQGSWLPARSVGLHDTAPDGLEVGAVLERTITIEARGLTAAHLPPLPLPDGARRTVADSSTTIAADGTVRARRVEIHRLIVARPGVLTLPPIALAWWDTAAEKPRRAFVPARPVTIGSAGQAPVPAPHVEKDAPAPAPPPKPSVWRRAGWVGLALLLAGMATWVLARLPGQEQGRSRAGERAARRDFAAAMAAGNANGAASAVLAWGACRWPGRPPRSLGALARRLDDPAAARALHAIEAARFAPGGGSWDGPALLAAMARPPRRRHQKPHALPPLYPVQPPGEA